MIDFIINAFFLTGFAFGIWVVYASLLELNDIISDVRACQRQDSIELERTKARLREIENFLWRSRPTEGADHE